MFAYHPADAPSHVLNIVDTESRGAVQGIERDVLEFKWRFHGLPIETLPVAVRILLEEGLLRVAGSMYRLTRAGYSRLTVPQVAVGAPLPNNGSNADGRPTEHDLRGKLLGVFSDQSAGRGGKLTAGELNRYWAAAGYRAGDLRSGLDSLVRDGHLVQSPDSKTAQWSIQRALTSTSADEAPLPRPAP